MAHRTNDTHEVRRAGETTSYNAAQQFYEEMGEKEERMPDPRQNDHSSSDDSDERKSYKEDKAGYLLYRYFLLLATEAYTFTTSLSTKYEKIPRLNPIPTSSQDRRVQFKGRKLFILATLKTFPLRPLPGPLYDVSVLLKKDKKKSLLGLLPPGGPKLKGSDTHAF